MISYMHFTFQVAIYPREHPITDVLLTLPIFIVLLWFDTIVDNYVYPSLQHHTHHQCAHFPPSTSVPEAHPTYPSPGKFYSVVQLFSSVALGHLLLPYISYMRFFYISYEKDHFPSGFLVVFISMIPTSYIHIAANYMISSFLKAAIV